MNNDLQVKFGWHIPNDQAFVSQTYHIYPSRQSLQDRKYRNKNNR